METTLRQELIAPEEVHFYNDTLQCFGTRSDLRSDISLITGIDPEVLSPEPNSIGIRDLLDGISLARRMSWASKRQTTRKEDIAYCLLGIFGVNMAMMYGEGAKAFVRLQEEIMHNGNDLSLFAWRSEPPTSELKIPAGENTETTVDNFSGILALSPAEFSSSHNIVLDRSTKFNPDFSMSNKGLRIQIFLWSTDTELVIMPLHCHQKGNESRTLGIFLKPQGGNVYARADTHYLEQKQINASTSAEQTLFVAKNLTADVNQNIRSVHRHALNFKFEIRDPKCRLVETRPQDLWDPLNERFITKGHENFVAFHRLEAILGTDSGTDRFSLVVACGCGRNDMPWVCVGKENDPLVSAALRGDMGKVGELGARRGRMARSSLAKRQSAVGIMDTFQESLGQLGSRLKVKVTAQLQLVEGEPVVFVVVKVTNPFFVVT